MSFQNFKKHSYCKGGRHKSATKNIYGVILELESCNRKKSITVPGNTIQAELLGDISKNLRKKDIIDHKKVAKNVIKNAGRALDITANIATATASENLEAALSTLPKSINIFNKGKGLYVGKFV